MGLVENEIPINFPEIKILNLDNIFHRLTGKRVLYNFFFVGTDAPQAPWFEVMNRDINT